MNLQSRITLMFAALLITVTGISATLIHSFLLDNLIAQQKKELTLKGQFWIEKIKHSEEAFEAEDIAELDKLLVSNRKVEILLLGKKKKVLYTSLPSSNLNEWLQALERKVEKRKDKNIWFVGGDDYVVVSLGLKNDEKQRLILASPVRGLKEVRMELTEKIILILLIGVGSAILLSFFITRSMVRPLSRLTKEIKKVQFRRFSEVQLVPARGEIAEVSESVYSMAQELDRFHEIQRQFLQNASHELKTPLMSIQGYAEGIRDGIFVEETAHKGLDVIVSETNRIKHIVTEITLLAKLESEEDLFHPATHSAADLVNRAVERLHPIKLQQNIAIAIRTYDEDGIVYVDDDKILQALLNLIANGLRHATEQIEIKVQSGKRFVTIEIIDDGDGIPEDLLPHLFHRFVKGKNGDVGLGLAITRAIIERSGGTIEVRNGVFTGAIFRITLPLQQPGSHI
ncbi:cell wall metabolism sensor histidine kinase WalK [uncultured Brevibacillus sp.]|uniref:sensor histidine kinase n=1 Tax=uncultured Brevibacillus sp. TaxID=169970 RepID=UPI002594E9AC|nr:HAMP domain-containing sensor histidine kinase [uncultured Brevibacillus sp.]